MGIAADAKQFTSELLKGLNHKDVKSFKYNLNRDKRMSRLQELKKEWDTTLKGWTNDQTHKVEGQMQPRHAIFEACKVLPKDVMVSTDIGNICSVSNSYLNFSNPRSFFAALT